MLGSRGVEMGKRRSLDHPLIVFATAGEVSVAI